MADEKNCYHPIIYVRGFAATQGEIDETVADPYMGFNVGSAKARTVLDRRGQALLLRVAAGAADGGPRL